MELDAIENLAAKYLEVGGTGRLASHCAFIRIAEEEPELRMPSGRIGLVR